ncbi:hypothetical protein [Amycolatopsis sp. CA-230715]|uniref:hypothetical protein n=1 Tax=Amycolatopsis sp. CA-230715 TaxID=2745196 RepID=UPI001C019F0C|nr:hypothetical protein [Amycolatopsis sp. CA-230715]QWF81156.1 hypothetical protein HUW46_04582 [Amycolatopsis sp. CA-230715]
MLTVVPPAPPSVPADCRTCHDRPMLVRAVDWPLTRYRQIPCPSCGRAAALTVEQFGGAR